MGSNRESRRRDDFRDLKQRCDWCGKYVHDPRRFHTYNRGDLGTWCSDECRAAGQYYMSWVMGIIVFVFGVVIISLFFLPSSPVWSSDTDEALFGLGFVILFLGLIRWNISRTIRRGGRIRNEKHRALPGERMPRTYMEIEEIHEKILQFIKTFPANNGVMRKQIEEHLKQEGILLAHTNIALNNLIEHGYVHRTRRMRYIIS